MLPNSVLNYCTLDKELFALVQVVKKRKNYLMEQEIIMHCIHQPSRYLQAQNQISVDDCSYVRHSPSYKLVRCGSLQLCEMWNIATM